MYCYSDALTLCRTASKPVPAASQSPGPGSMPGIGISAFDMELEHSVANTAATSKAIVVEALKMGDNNTEAMDRSTSLLKVRNHKDEDQQTI